MVTVTLGSEEGPREPVKECREGEAVKPQRHGGRKIDLTG